MPKRRKIGMDHDTNAIKRAGYESLDRLLGIFRVRANHACHRRSGLLLRRCSGTLGETHTGEKVMPAGDRGLDLSADEVALMSQLGIAEARIREILATEEGCTSDATSEALTAHPSGLSATERDILRRGGARGLDDPTAVHRRRQRANLEALIQACRALLQNAQDTATVASRLHLPEDAVANQAHHVPPQLSAIELPAIGLTFPAWQFTETGTIPHLSALLAVAGATLPPLVLTRFMVTPHVDLDVGHGRLSPRDWLVRGLDPDPVLDAARALVGE